MKDIEQMVAQLDELIAKSEIFTFTEPEIFEARQNYTAAQTLTTRMEAAIGRMTLPGSTYLIQVEQARALNLQDRMDSVRSTVIALRDDLKSGWIRSVMELVHANTHGEYLEMADTLLASGYKDAAAVITGTALEVHVRALCVKNGVDTELPNGNPKKATVMNADLKKSDVYATLQEKQVTTWMDLRNQAAHGNYEKYDIGEVRALVGGVRDFMLRYPA
ncbi:hypothetical protein [Streptomyces sp. NPDC127105]|uniref:hypothetical protein n=1 Tax=Streptomyces sp. NPDC127105 TaxID=3345359 RepID=UPI003668C3B5